MRSSKDKRKWLPAGCTLEGAKVKARAGGGERVGGGGVGRGDAPASGVEPAEAGVRNVVHTLFVGDTSGNTCRWMCRARVRHSMALWRTAEGGAGALLALELADASEAL
jgi:hypothetical protein